MSQENQLISLNHQRMESYKEEVIKHFDSIAPQRSAWFTRNKVYHEQIIDACRLFLNPDSRVLELGCSVGDLLGHLKPTVGVGIDFSPEAIRQAKLKYPQYEWICADVEALPQHSALNEAFDLIILEDLTGYLNDIQGLLESIKTLMHPKTRVIVSSWNWLWEPILKLAEAMKLKSHDLHIRQNWISATALKIFLHLADYEILEVRSGLLFPYSVPFVSKVINAFSYAPIINAATLLSIFVLRPQLEQEKLEQRSVSVIIPTRNEAGNIQDLVERTPKMGSHTELIFVDGNSSDGTVERIHQEIAKHPELDIKFIPQVSASQNPGELEISPNLMLKLGKGDAVRKGFAAASGEILMILDSDISVPPEELERFYRVLASKKARFANGTRFVYTQEVGAMKPLNRLGNVFFSWTFSWLLGQKITDTLCGTKVLYKSDYEEIVKNRAYFGEFDPFGDFDLLFGASRLNHSMVDVPIHYLARTYGESKVRVNQHGPLLGRMSLLAFWYFKLQPLWLKIRPSSAKTLEEKL